jgi:hypothetical protein
MATHVGVDVGVFVGSSTIEKKNASIFAGLAFLVGVFVGYSLKGLRIAYLKKKHDFFDRQAKKAKEQLTR